MKKIHFLLLEIILLISLLSVIAILGISKSKELITDFPRYTITFKNVDGLSVGSPVRLAGVRIGHVIKQELKNNGIVVTFKVTNKNVKIPEGSYAGVEFTGLGGSKSLEIKPSDEKTEEIKGFCKIEPLRVNSFMETQNVIAKATLDFFNSMLSFLNQKGKEAKGNLNKASKQIQEQTDSFTEIQGEIKKQEKNYYEDTKKIKKLIHETSENVSQVNKTINNFSTSTDIKENLSKIKGSTEHFSNFIENTAIKDFNNNVKTTSTKLTKVKDRELKYVKDFNDSIKIGGEKLEKFINSYEQKEDKIN